MTKQNNSNDLLGIIDAAVEHSDSEKTHVGILNEQLIPVSDMLPTGRQHISYSEIHDWIECQWRHKLKYIDKIDLDSETIHTVFGQLIHNSIEEYVKQPVNDRKPIDSKAVYDNWMNEGSLAFIARHEQERPNVVKDYTSNRKDFDDSIIPILDAVPQWLDDQFPGWELVGAEHKLYESIEKFDNRFFKGFVDCIIKVPNPKKPKEFLYYVIDWKTSSWGWSFEKKTSFNKQLQLVLYKHFLSKVLNVPLKEIRCGFVLLKRTPPKSSPNARCELVMVSVGPKAEEKAIDIVSRMLMHLNKKLYAKNRLSCKFCKYHYTEYCT